VVSGAADRLSRLLALVPYLLNRQGIPLPEAAAAAGVTEQQLIKDLELLFVCGLPGHLPDDLIEAEWEDGRVFLGNADTIDRPLRLGMDEVAALLVGLRLLSGLPGAGQSEALEKAIAKLQEVAGSTAEAAEERVGVAPPEVPAAEVLDGVRAALAAGKRLHLRYWVPWRDEATERDVDPMRLALVDRLDRVLALSVLDTTATPPPDAGRNLDAGLFRPGAEDTVATFRLTARARWVSEYYPCENVEEQPDGGAVVRLRTADPAWVVRLALRLGADATLLDPPELADTVRLLAGEALAAYGVAL
jgi:proteasome accessory factor C